jgi:ABC-type transport system involved in multi-copper enzyme maturation permease subunit
MNGQGFTIALRAECFVMLRNWKIWLLIVAPAIASVIHLLLIRVNTASANIQQSLSGGARQAEVDYAYGYFVDGLSTGLILVYLLFIAFAAFSFAIDRDHGVIRHLVIRQSSRRAILAAKALLLHVMAICACLLLLIFTWLLCSLLWDFGPVVEDGYELISIAEIHEEINTGLVLALLPIPACLSLGLLLSVLANSTLQAVSLGLGVSLLLDIFKTALGEGAYYLYISFHPSLLDNSYLKEVSRIVRGFSDILIDERFMQLNYWIPIPQALVFFVLAMFLVGRKSL